MSEGPLAIHWSYLVIDESIVKMGWMCEGLVALHWSYLIIDESIVDGLDVRGAGSSPLVLSSY